MSRTSLRHRKLSGMALTKREISRLLSGIPFAYFDYKNWRLQAFGRYVGPISQFAYHDQPEFAQPFYKTNAVPLDFGLGYRWRRNESNLLLAVKAAPN
jgi:hypothetical protein